MVDIKDFNPDKNKENDMKKLRIQKNISNLCYKQKTKGKIIS